MSVPTSPVPARARWTYADYAALTPSDSAGYQVLQGELIVSPSPTRAHQWVVTHLSALLSAHVERNGLGEVYVAPLDVILDADNPEPENVVQPDILFVSGGRLGILGEDNVKGAPDLVVEVLSPGTARYDRVEKLKLYHRFGVKDCWIVDAELEIVEAFDLSGDTPKVAAAHAGDDVFRPGAFPGLEIDLKGFWFRAKSGT